MKIFLFAVFLAIVQTAPPVPRKAPDKSAGSSHTVKKDSSDKQAPTTSPSLPNAVATKPDQNGSNPPPKANEPESVAVRELPPVTIATDWWNRFYVLFTGLLVAIGIAGVRAAYRTLQAIERQTEETANATKAMRDQVIAQRESIRARITIGFGNDVLADILHDGRVVVIAKFMNTGGIPTYKVTPETWIEFLPRKFEDFTHQAVHHIGNPVAVYPTTPTLFDIPLGRRANYEEIAGLRKAQITLGVRIRLTYESMGQAYFVDRAFSADPNGMVLHPKYNDAN